MRRFTRKRRPIHSGRWRAHRGEILAELRHSADLHERTPKEEMEDRKERALYPAVAGARRRFRVFATERKMLRETLREWGDETMLELVGVKRKKKVTPSSAIEYALLLMGSPEGLAPDEALIGIDLPARLDSLSRVLTRKERLVLDALVAAGGDHRRAARKLKMKPGTYKVWKHRIFSKIPLPL